MELCNNCGEEIEQFTLTNATLEITGGQKFKIMRLGCPSCNHIQHTFASDSPITALRKRIKELEDIVKTTNR